MAITPVITRYKPNVQNPSPHVGYVYLVKCDTYMYIHIHIYIRLGVPRSFQAPSALSRYYKRCYGIEMGGGGV